MSDKQPVALGGLAIGDRVLWPNMGTQLTGAVVGLRRKPNGPPYLLARMEWDPDPSRAYHPILDAWIGIHELEKLP